MNNISDAINSSVWGIARGAAVQIFIYPLDTLKIHKQSNLKRESTWRIAKLLYKTEGWRAFYRGIYLQLTNTSLKQAWSWPMITGIPTLLGPYSLHPLAEQLVTGFSISTIDATLSASLVRKRILSIVGSKERSFSVFNLKEGWKGFASHWSKLFTSWSTFLVAQKYFRERVRETSNNQKLSLLQLVDVGMRVALLVSITSAPFDVANTLKQTHNLGFLYIIRNPLSTIFSGWWPLRVTTLVIHNVASVILIDILDSSKSHK